MKIDDVRGQLNAVIGRAIETGVSVQQNFPIISNDDKFQELGALPGASIALRNVPYQEIYSELEGNQLFHLKMPDGGLLIFQYRFDKAGDLNKHRLGFFPSPVLPTLEEAPELYQYDEIYGDIITKQIVRFPIRFDYDPGSYKQKYHPHSHLTLGQFKNCRIPVSHAVSPNDFLLFVVRNFYHQLYRRHSNVFEKKMKICLTEACITDFERAFPHFSF